MRSTLPPNKNSSVHLSRLLATAAAADPPDPSRPAVLYRRNTAESSRPQRALSRSPYAYHLQGARTPDGCLYFWRKPGVAPAVPPDAPFEMLRAVHRPYTGAELTDERFVTWCPAPSTPETEKDERNARLSWLFRHPGCTVLLREDCNKSLRSYYERRRPQYDYVYRNGNLYATYDRNPPVLPEHPDVPPYYVPGGPPAVPVQERHEPDLPHPGTVNAYLSRQTTVRLLQRAFPSASPVRDVGGTQHDRYVQLRTSSDPSTEQCRFLANCVTVFTGQDAEPPHFLQTVHGHQFRPAPYRQTLAGPPSPAV